MPSPTYLSPSPPFTLYRENALLSLCPGLHCVAASTQGLLRWYVPMSPLRAASTLFQAEDRSSLFPTLFRFPTPRLVIGEEVGRDVRGAARASSASTKVLVAYISSSIEVLYFCSWDEEYVAHLVVSDCMHKGRAFSMLKKVLPPSLQARAPNCTPRPQRTESGLCPVLPSVVCSAPLGFCVPDDALGPSSTPSLGSSAPTNFPAAFAAQRKQAR